MKYFAVYKCPLCGQLSRLNDSVEIQYNDLPAVLGKIVQNQMFIGNPYLHKAPMQVVCKCSDGNVGLAQFAGFVQDKSNEDKDVINFMNKLLNNFK